MDEQIIAHLKNYGYSDEAIEEYIRKRKIAEEYQDKYHKDRACCPVCGSKTYTTTLVGYTLNVDSPELYKDENDCTCHDCGDKHIYHDRVPMKRKWLNKNKNG